jgi:cobaltochelatase CobT
MTTDTGLFINSMSKLASMLGARYGVKVQVSGTGAFTDYRGKSPIINLPLVTAERGQEVLLRGYIDHEAGHVRYTDRKIFNNARVQQSYFVKTLWNICEDVYIERRMSAAFRGCGQNLRRIAIVLFRGKIEPTTSEPVLEQALSYILYGCRSIPVQELRPEAAVLRDAFPWPSILPELDKLIARSAVTKNSAECLSLAEEMEALIISAYKQEYGEKQSQQDSQGQDSQSGQGQGSQKPLTKEEQKRAASLKKKLDKAINKIAKTHIGSDNITPGEMWEMMKKHRAKSINDGHGYYSSGAEDIKHKLDIGRAIADKLASSNDIEKYTGCRSMTIRKAAGCNPLSQEDIILGDRMAVQLASRMSSVLQTRSLVKRGTGSVGTRLDNHRLYRPVVGDARIFRHDIPGRTPDVEIMCLVDTSGSMYGDSIDVVNQTMYAIVKATQNIRGCAVGIMSFNTIMESVKDMYTPVPPVRLTKMEANGSTYLGSALMRVLDCFTEKARRHVVIILTDGMADDLPILSSALDRAEQNAVEVYGLGIGAGGSYIGDVMGRKHFRDIRHNNAIPAALLGMLGEALRI